MLFDRIKAHRRQRLLQHPFPTSWAQLISRNVAHAAYLSEEERQRLYDFVQIFVAEKRWEGCGGLEMTEESQVTIAAQAGLLVLGLPHEYFKNVESILVYPTTVITPERPDGVFVRHRGDNYVQHTGLPIVGEAQLYGPVILVWDTVARNAKHPGTGHNVVYHEFAHKLDMLDGAADGTPPLKDRAALRRWAEVCERAFLDLRQRLENGEQTYLDGYGATNEAEFFAVATEQFFNRPDVMLSHEPDLYDVLKDFYQQDPEARLRRFRSATRSGSDPSP